MARAAIYEEEFYPYGSRTGIQEYLNESLRQAPWWLISVAAHALVAVVLTLAHFTDYREDPAVVVDSQLIEDKEVEPAEELEREVFERDEEINTDEPPIEDPVMKDADLSDHTETDSNEDYESAKGVEDAMSDAPFQGKYWNTAIGVGGAAGGCFGSRYGGRRDLAAAGGSRHTEKSLIVGLIWLKNHQNPDGMWSCDKFMMNCKNGTCNGAGSHAEYDTGVTGLATLAFLGAGYTHRRGRFKHVVRKAVQALKARQSADGCYGPKTADGHWIYNHAIATMAMAEAYGLSGGSSLLRSSAQKAVDLLVECQNPYLGWRYGRQPGESDSSVTGWAVLALKSAKIAELHVPDSAFDGALNWFNKVTDEAYYRTGYVTKGDSGGRPSGAIGKFQSLEAMTAAALISRIFIQGRKAKNRPEVLGAANLLKQKLPTWDVRGGTIDMYYWYYGSLAMFQLGGTYWDAWNKAMKDALVPTQRRKGCENGSWDRVGVWGQAGGRVYSTALNCLTLEIYYRYGRILNVR
ncbi:MAG: prenyltransferase/squalene oxidase repeat-containing protein [Planctomycetota bacterium]|jgi:hypothetical protein